MDFCPWTVKNDDTLAWIFDFPKIIEEKGYLLNEGISVKDWMSDDLIIEFAKNKGIKLADAVPSYSNKLVLSEKLKKILQEHTEARFEFFPVKLRNHKGKIVDEAYYLANLILWNVSIWKNRNLLWMPL